ncbi:hypothetical protein CR513_13385, partial [Mucuna pruriens]
MLSFRRNLISISSLDKFGFSYSFENNKVSLYQNSNVVGSGSLIDNLYILVLDEILEPLDLSNFEFYVECIQEKRTNIRKLGAKRDKDVLEIIHTNICVSNIFKSFKVEVELQLGKKIKVVKSDCSVLFFPLISIAATSVVNISAQINSILMLNGTNFKVWKEVVAIVLDCTDFDLVLRVEKPILTPDNLQEVKIEK